SMNAASQPERLPRSATASVRRRLSRQGNAAALCPAVLFCLAALLGHPPRAAGQGQLGSTVTASAAMTVTDPSNNTRTIPGVVTWRGVVHLTGQGWLPGSGLDIYLRGPLNTLGVAPIERGPLFNLDASIDQNINWLVDSNGNFFGSFKVPYQNKANQA